MNRLISIDPGSNSTAAAYFEDGELKWVTTIIAIPKPTLQKKRVVLARDFVGIIRLGLPEDVQTDDCTIVCEEPFLRGPANTSMARFLGALENIFNGELNYIHPMTVKAFFKEREKLDVAIAAGAYLKTDREQDILAHQISKEAWDATDAIAIGIAFMERSKK